jgi:hypothetical protein
MLHFSLSDLLLVASVTYLQTDPYTNTGPEKDDVVNHNMLTGNELRFSDEEGNQRRVAAEQQATGPGLAYRIGSMRRPQETWSRI